MNSLIVQSAVTLCLLVSNSSIASTFTDIQADLEPVATGSVAWGDFDNDGDLDISLAGRIASGHGYTRIYTNHMGTFVESPPEMPGLFYSSAAWGDYDNDDDLDLILTGANVGLLGRTFLYSNSSAQLTEEPAGLPGVLESSAAWGDYDNDGDLDLLLAGDEWSFRSRLYRNDGGTFTEVDAGLARVDAGSAAWGDYDNDGDLDLVITGRQAGGPPPLTFIYRNDDGVLVDSDSGIEGVFSSSVAWGDYDNDGDLDLLIAGRMAGAIRISRIYRNDEGSFIDIGAGLEGVLGCSVVWGDYDNDGDLDILLTGADNDEASTTRLYENQGYSFVDVGARLEDVSSSSVAFGDYDADRDLDILMTGLTDSGGGSRISRIYRNDGTPPNTAPRAPCQLVASFVDGIATFSWAPGCDDETPVQGLSYNLRVGISPGGHEIMSAMAGADGLRRIPTFGNVQQNLSWSLDVSTYSGQTLYWSIQTVDSGYLGSPFSAERTLVLESSTSAPDRPLDLALHQNYPNPFNPRTTIHFTTAQAGRALLTVYDAAGHHIRTVVDEFKIAGRHEVIWNGLNEAGVPVASGLYFYRLRAGEFEISRRMVLVR